MIHSTPSAPPKEIKATHPSGRIDKEQPLFDSTTIFTSHTFEYYTDYHRLFAPLYSWREDLGKFLSRLKKRQRQIENNQNSNLTEYLAPKDLYDIYNYFQNALSTNPTLYLHIAALKPNKAIFVIYKNFQLSVLCCPHGKFKLIVDLEKHVPNHLSDNSDIQLITCLRIDSKPIVYSCALYRSNRVLLDAFYSNVVASKKFNPDHLVQVEFGPLQITDTSGVTFDRIYFERHFSSLDSYIQHWLPSLTYLDKAEIILQIIQTMCSVHDANYVHCNITPAAFYLYGTPFQFKIKLTQFELMTRCNCEATYFENGFESPEVVAQLRKEIPLYEKGKKYSLADHYYFKDPKKYVNKPQKPQFSLDIWSLGMIFFMLFYGEKPESTPEEFDILLGKIQRHPLLARCLSCNASSRENIHDILQLHESTTQEKKKIHKKLEAAKKTFIDFEEKKMATEQKHQYEIKRIRQETEQKITEISLKKSMLENKIPDLTKQIEELDLSRPYFLSDSFKSRLSHLEPSLELRYVESSDLATQVLDSLSRKKRLSLSASCSLPFGCEKERVSVTSLSVSDSEISSTRTFLTCYPKSNFTPKPKVEEPVSLDKGSRILGFHSCSFHE